MEVLSTELYESELSDDSKQVAVTVAGYIAKSLTKRSKCSQCKENLVARGNDIIHDQYLKLLSRGGLITPSPSLRDFVFQSFNILDITSAMLHKETGNKCIRKVSENLLIKLQSNVINFTCMEHEDWGKKISIRATINVFFNNEQKLVN